MKLRAFNKDKALSRLHLKRNKDVIISRGSIIVSVLILVVSIMYFAYARYESKRDFTLIDATVGDFKSGDYTIAAYVDNVKSRSIPAKDSGYYLQKVECDGGATGTWDSNNWELTVSNASQQTKCYVYFTTLIAESDQTGQYATLSRYYPVGSIYQTTTNDNPETLFGGCWTKIEGKFLLSSSSTYTLGSTGGSANAVLVSHSHTRGTMNITGAYETMANHNGDSVILNNSGALYYSKINSNWNNFTIGSSAFPHYKIFFDASRSWTGSTSVEGESGTGKNMPPYEVVNVYKRITCPNNN